MGACARQVDTHGYIFVACFCVNNTNCLEICVGSKGPLSSKRSSPASEKVTKFAKQEKL